jgi:hypothetical protein
VRRTTLMLPLIACLVLIQSAPAQTSTDQPTLEETLKWLHKVDENYKDSRFGKLTVDDLKTLEEIKLGGHRKSDNKHVYLDSADMRYLTALPALKKANLGEIDGFDDSALKFVGTIKTLTLLDLGDAQVTSAGVAHLRGLKNLTFLSLAFARQVNDEALPSITQLQNLESLFLSGTAVTNQGLAQLSKLPKLQEIRLGGMPELSDAGLLNLKDNKSLKTVVIGKKHKVTPEGIAALKKHLPDVTVK